MKKITLFISAVITLTACNNAPEADKAAITDTQVVATAQGTAYGIDSTTVVTWTGAKPTGTHAGTFKVVDGALVVNDNKLSGGGFTIDVNSLNNIDLASDAENKGKLEGHLKSADFFDVEKHPTAKFEITSVEPYVADANVKTLTKDATHLIKGTSATANADFNIDRTLWGMNYKGPNNPQDWVINKEVNIKLALSATKK